MQLLPKWVLPPTMPSVYETESFTALEMVSKLYGAVNELIAQYNATIEQLNGFQEAERQAREEFELNLTKDIKQFICETESKFLDLEGTAQKVINEAIQTGAIQIAERYDPETESLYIGVVGGV